MVKTMAFAGLALFLGTGVVEGGEKDPLLEKRAGVWEWEGWMDMGGQRIECASIETNEWILGDRYLLSKTRQTATEGGMTFEWMILAQAGPEKGEYRSWFWDQMGLSSTSKGKVVDGAIHWTSQSESMGESLHVFQVADDGTATLKLTWKPPGKDEWQTFLDMKGKKIEKAPDAPGKPGPQVTPDPYLDRLVGKWEWDGEIQAGGKGMPYQASQEHSWVLGGNFLMGDYICPDAAGTGHGYAALMMYQKSRAGKGYRGWFFDSAGDFMEEKGTVEGDTLTLLGTFSAGKARSTLVFKEDGTIDITSEWMMGEAKDFAPHMKAVGKKAE